LADDFKGKPPHWLLGVNSYWSELSASRFVEFHRHANLEYYIMILYYWIREGCGVYIYIFCC
jgi:hypothetical protein